MIPDRLPPQKRQYVVESSATLHDALALIEENRHRSLIVVNPEGAAVGALSDGDVRKALLKGRLLVTPVDEVMNTNFVCLREEEKGKAAALFAERRVFLIPVVDRSSLLVDVLEAY